YLVTTLTKATKDPSLTWIDMLGMSAVAGIGFTVSLLVSELSFSMGDPMYDWAKVGVLTASLLAAILSAIILIPRNRIHKHAAEQRTGAQTDEAAGDRARSGVEGPGSATIRSRTPRERGPRPRGARRADAGPPGHPRHQRLGASKPSGLISTSGTGDSIATRCEVDRSEEHTSELQSRFDLVCRLLLEKKKKKHRSISTYDIST